MMPVTLRRLSILSVFFVLLGGASFGCGSEPVIAPANEAADFSEDAENTEDAPVRIGLERIESGEVDRLAGLRIGLVAHAASVTQDGRHAIDVLQASGAEIVRLFGPEHGLRGEAAAGEKVESGRDTATGLPITSLYGKVRKPQPEHLADLDALVIDLQGAGVRFYTYVSTMILCLEAAAEAQIELIVLDRPNPLGGNRIEGPTSAPRSEVPASFVNLAPGPLVHGLTMGEMARYVNSTRDQPADLTIIEMTGWARSMTWLDLPAEDGKQRPWVPPSPNLRTPEAALAYPGTALLEATNVSEGRGTEGPFLIVGAPWIEPENYEISAPGFKLTPTTFTPTSSPAAPNPKYPGEECRGWRIEVVDPAIAGSYRLGLEIVSALVQHPQFEWRRDGEALTWLLGTEDVGSGFRANRASQDIADFDLEAHQAWRDARRSSLLYRPDSSPAQPAQP